MVSAAGRQSVPCGSLRAVLLDAVGTLLYPDPPVVAAYLTAGRRHGSRLPEAEIARRFRAAWRADGLGRRLPAGATETRSSPLATSPARERERWRSIVGTIFDDVHGAVAEQLFNDLWSHFAQPAHWRLFPDVAPALAELAGMGVICGVASNFDERLHVLAAGHPPLGKCGPRFISSEIGWAKPAAEFYAAIEGQLGLAPHELVLVGDDLENDVLAPRRCGWRAIHLVRGPMRSETCTPGAVGSLTEAVAQIRPLVEAAP